MFLFRLWRKVLWFLFHRDSQVTALVYNPQCLSHQTGEDNPEVPERLSVILTAIEQSDIKGRLKQTTSNTVSDAQIARVHPPSYVSYLESLQPDEGLKALDGDTVMNGSSLSAARYAAGAVVKAVDMVVKQKVINAFCLVRPPGHHAQTKKTQGFCFLNNVAIGVMHALNQHRLQRVAIVDFDAHHGDGTEEIFKDDNRVMLLSSFQHPFFPFGGDKPTGSNPNIVLNPLKAGSGSNVIRHIVEKTWLPRLKAFRPEMIFISAGFDGHKNDSMSHLNFTEQDFAWITEKLIAVSYLYAKGRIVSVLEGGYDLQSLSISALAHITALTD